MPIKINTKKVKFSKEQIIKYFRYNVIKLHLWYMLWFILF